MAAWRTAVLTPRSDGTSLWFKVESKESARVIRGDEDQTMKVLIVKDYPVEKVIYPCKNTSRSRGKCVHYTFSARCIGRNDRRRSLTGIVDRGLPRDFNVRVSKNRIIIVFNQSN